MNSNHSNDFHSKRAPRAHFSPADHRVANTQSVYDAATHQPTSGPSRFGGSQSAAVEDLFSQFWTPGLLDRLQPPLTRYRE
jgi:hypothetical protein